jgi:hypothetical protein
LGLVGINLPSEQSGLHIDQPRDQAGYPNHSGKERPWRR